MEYEALQDIENDEFDLFIPNGATFHDGAFEPDLVAQLYGSGKIAFVKPAKSGKKDALPEPEVSPQTEEG